MCMCKCKSYTMNFVLLVLALKILEISCGNEKETHERAASLVVLPPLVLGYEELYVDNDDNKPAKKDMNYPDEDDEKTGTDGTEQKEQLEHNDEMEQNDDVVEEYDEVIAQKDVIPQKNETKKKKEPERLTLKKDPKTDKKKVEEKKDKKKDNSKGKDTDKKNKKKDLKKDKKKKETKKDKKKDSKTITKKDKKKDNKKRDSKKDKKAKKKDTGKKKVKRRGKFKRSSESRSDTESKSDSQSEIDLSKDSDILDTINSPDLLSNQPAVYEVGRIFSTLPTMAAKMKSRGYNIDERYVIGLKTTISPLSKLISVISRRMDNPVQGDKQTGLRSGEDKGVITLKGQGEIGEGKEVLEFTGNFRVPKKVLDCPCFKEILEKEKPIFKRR